MPREIDEFYLQKNEPVRGCLLALRQVILAQDAQISEAWKYRMPFFCYNGKMLCYLWVHKKLLQPYIGIVEGKKIDHPALIMEQRARMKIMLFNPDHDLPVTTIKTILQQAVDLCRT